MAAKKKALWQILAAQLLLVAVPLYGLAPDLSALASSRSDWEPKTRLRVSTSELDEQRQASQRLHPEIASGDSFHAEGIGTIRALTDELGQVADRYTLEAFGTLLDHQGDDPNAYLFAGEPLNSPSGLSYSRARWLALARGAGRFLSQDPLARIGLSDTGTSFFQYAQQRPTMYVDPSGLRFLPAFGYQIEDELCAQYRASTAGSEVEVSCGAWAREGLFINLKPDILDRRPDQRSFMEIKPLSISGIARGSHQIALYTISMGVAGYTPNVSWMPPSPMIRIDGQLVGVFNFLGILFYTDAVENLEELGVFAGAKSLSEIRRLLRMPKFAARTVLWEASRVRRLVSIGSAASRARANLNTGTALTLASFGVV